MTPTVNKKISVRFRRKRSLPCPHCKAREHVICYGFQKNGRQRYYCKSCGKTFNKYTETPFAGLRTPPSKVAQCVQALCENQGHSNASRLLKRKRREIVNWLQRSGVQCLKVFENFFVGKKNPLAFLEFDELRTFVHCKQFEHWVWHSIDAVHNTWLGLHVSFSRSLEEGKTFFRTFQNKVNEVAGASSDGLQEYATLMHARFPEVPYAQVVKHYEGRRLVSVEHKQVSKHTVADVEFVITALKLGSELNTSATEHLNDVIRGALACLNRKTLKYPKDVGNLTALLYVLRAYYNLCLVQRGLKTTPFVSAGFTDREWTFRELLSFRV